MLACCCDCPGGTQNQPANAGSGRQRQRRVGPILAFSNLELYYPEWFSLHYNDSQATKQTRDGFVLLGFNKALEWVSHCKIVKGGLTNLPMNDKYVRVSREAAKKARLSKCIETVPAKKAAYAARYQKGWESEKAIIDDFFDKGAQQKNWYLWSISLQVSVIALSLF